MKHPLTERLREARGKQYYAMLKAIFRDIGADIQSDAKQWHSEEGKITVPMLGALAVKYQLPFKAVVEYLEECLIVPTGLYDHIHDLKYKMPDGTVRPFRVSMMLECGAAYLAERPAAPPEAGER